MLMQTHHWVKAGVSTNLGQGRASDREIAMHVKAANYDPSTAMVP